MITIRVTHVVLHVTDNKVVPVRKIKGTVFTKFYITGTKILITGGKKVTQGFAPYLSSRSFTFQLILFDAKETNRIGYHEITLVGCRKVFAGNHSIGRYGTHLHIQKFLHLEAFFSWHHLVCTSASSIGSIVVAPFIKTDAVWIRAVVSMITDVVSTRIESEHTGRTRVQ